MTEYTVFLLLKFLQIPSERKLLESDAPDAMPNSELGSLFLVDEDPSLPQEFLAQGRSSASNVSIPSDNQSFSSRDASTLSKDMLNHPANIHNVCFLLQLKGTFDIYLHPAYIFFPFSYFQHIFL